MVAEKISGLCAARTGAILALAASIGVLAGCASAPATTTTRTVTTESTAPVVVPQSQTTTVQRTVTTP